MAVLICKICGGNIEVSPDKTLGTCQYCGTTMTIPKIDTDRKARLYNRAIQYLNNCEFDKAYSSYESIALEDEQEAEAYWGMILSEYGIEYVEDPNDNRRIPTCHRTISMPLKKSTNYDLAIKYASDEQKELYEQEAENIERIQSSIKSISSKEEPYDVFICYKETDDEFGERTQDSVLAFEIFEELEKRGLKVFFSRVTLAEKIGADYEPYIYSALISAKVMLLVSQNEKYIESVWVKNEWSRYIKMISQGQDKLFIPVLKDVDVSLLPDELKRYQAHDMSKVGALQDLGREVFKIIENQRIENKSVERAKKIRYGIIIGIAAILSICLVVGITRKGNKDDISESKQIEDKKTAETVEKHGTTTISKDNGSASDTEEEKVEKKEDRSKEKVYYYDEYNNRSSDKKIEYYDGYFYYTYDWKIYRTTGPDVKSEVFEENAGNFLIYNDILYAIKRIDKENYQSTISAYSLDGTIKNDDITDGKEKNAWAIHAIDNGVIVYEYIGDAWENETYSLTIMNTIDNEKTFRNSIFDLPNHIDVYIDSDAIYIAYTDAYEPQESYDYSYLRTDLIGAGKENITEDEYPFDKHDPKRWYKVENELRSNPETKDLYFQYFYHDFGCIWDMDDNLTICNMQSFEATKIEYVKEILGGANGYIAYMDDKFELFDCVAAEKDMNSQQGDYFSLGNPSGNGSSNDLNKMAESPDIQTGWYGYWDPNETVHQLRFETNGSNMTFDISVVRFDGPEAYLTGMCVENEDGSITANITSDDFDTAVGKSFNIVKSQKGVILESSDSELSNIVGEYPYVGENYDDLEKLRP